MFGLNLRAADLLDPSVQSYPSMIISNNDATFLPYPTVSQYPFITVLSNLHRNFPLPCVTRSTLVAPVFLFPIASRSSIMQPKLVFLCRAAGDTTSSQCGLFLLPSGDKMFG